MAQDPGVAGWVEITERVAGWAAAVAGVLVVCWRRIKGLAGALGVAHGLHREFGADAARSLRLIVDSLQRSQSESQIRHALAEQHLGLGVYVCDREGRCTWANEYLCERFGLSLEEMRGHGGHGWLRSIAPEHYSRAWERWDFAITNQLPYQDDYDVINARTGERWHGRTETLTRVVHGEIVYHLGYVIEEPLDDGLAEPDTHS